MDEQKCSVTDITPKCLEILVPVYGDEAPLEVQEIISIVCGISPLNLSINSGEIFLSLSDRKKILSFCYRRAKHEPLQYISGKAFFMYDEFQVGPGVLIPRSDTERLVEKASEVAIKIFGKKNKMKPKIRFLEFCTGSGCVGISLIKVAQQAGVNIFGVGTDISCDALFYARANADALGVKEYFKIVHHDMFSNDFTSLTQNGKTFDIVIANPPYICSKVIDTLSPEIKSFEPKIALDGGEDGLKFYRALVKLALLLLAPGGVIITEIGYDQSILVKDIFSSSNMFTDIKVLKDYSGNPRIVKAQKRIC